MFAPGVLVLLSNKDGSNRKNDSERGNAMTREAQNKEEVSERKVDVPEEKKVPAEVERISSGQIVEQIGSRCPRTKQMVEGTSEGYVDLKQDAKTEGSCKTNELAGSYADAVRSGLDIL